MRWVWHVLRQRAVLTAIFVCSLTYFLVKTGILTAVISFLIKPDVEELMLDRYKMTMQRQIKWYSPDESNGLAMNANENGNNNNDSSLPISETLCRNTRQGPTHVTDDRGYTCDRSYLMTNGCCDVAALSRLKTAPERFSCANCDQGTTGCCGDYEGCVSCCLRPDQKSILLDVIQSTSGHRLRQILAARDQFELCLLKCRTSSNSVHSENKYKSDNLKYCYKQEPIDPFRR